MEWRAPGADAATAARALGECRRLALQAARRAEVPGFMPQTVIGTDRQGRPVVAPTAPLQLDPFVIEQDLTSRCMERRGYVLAPLP